MFFVSIASGTSIHPFFDDLFKGVDFDKLAKDIESMLEEEEKLPKNPHASQSQSLRLPSSLGVPAQKATSAQPQAASVNPIRMDKKSLFLDPLVIQKNGGQKPSYTFPPEKFESFTFYKNEFIEELKHIEREIDLPGEFSIEFKEQFLKHKATIDTIVVALEFIANRRFYIRAFFLPQFNELRKKVIEALEKLYQLNKRIALKVYAEQKTEKDKQESDIATLQHRSQEKQKKINPKLKIPLRKKKQFHRGKSVLPQSSVAS